MKALMGMSVIKMVIILPSALVAMYLVLSLQKYLSNRPGRIPGLMLPVGCFIAATVLAVRPLILADPGEYNGLGIFCLRMWLTFNIPTILFAFQYIRQKKVNAALQHAMSDQNESGTEPQ